MSTVAPLPPIVIDTREQAPFGFEGILTTPGTLRAGDYSLLGFERCVAVERKSHPDAWGCAGKERKRFERCLTRLASLDRAAIVIEPALPDFLEPPEGITRLSAASAVGAYISWSVQFGIPVFWCGNRAYAERVVFRFLQSWWRHRGGLWVKQAIASNADVAERSTGKRSRPRSTSPPYDSTATPAGVRKTSSVIDALTAASTAGVTALRSKGE